MKIKDVLKNGIEIIKNKEIEDVNLKARIILADILGKSKEYLMIHDDEELNDRLAKLYFEKMEKLNQGIPLQYITNHQEFMGYDFYVDENVLIPQPDTENLVEEVIQLTEKIDKERNEKKTVLDMCTGSGAIGISLSKILDKNYLIYASDVSKDALKVAEDNSNRLMANVLFIESDLFKKISNLYKFDIIVSNPPYIETKVIDGLSKEVKNEPMLALDGGKDGLDFYRKISKQAYAYLNEGGFLAFEIGYDQRESVSQILEDNGYKNIYSRKDLSGNDRVVVGQK